MAIGTPGLSGGSASSAIFESVPLGGKRFFTIGGVATVAAGVTAASLPIVRPSTQKGLANGTMTIPANAEITRVSIRTLGSLTLAAATGKLKLAPTLANANVDNYVETAAAVAGVLAAQTVQNPNPLDSTTSVGGSDVVYSIYATDGGVGAAAVASTVTAAVETKIYVVISGYIESDFPANETFDPILATFS